MDAFGTVHVLINNAGILRDKAFKNMGDAEWDMVTLVHLKGAYSCTRACWGLFRNQKVSGPLLRPVRLSREEHVCRMRTGR